jgi:tetratricopeptide (TPR) repeat protein
VKGGPSEAASLLNQAIAAHQSGRLREALILYDQVLTRDQNAIEAIQNAGLALLQLGDARAAIARLKIAIFTFPNDAPCHMLLGNAYESLQQSEAAIPCFERAIELDPRDAQAHHNLAVALNSLDRLDEAISVYGRALEIEPAYVQAHNNLAQALQLVGRFDEAIASAQTAIKLKPDFDEAYRNLGNALYDADRLDEAVKAYRQALKIDPNNIAVRMALITAFIKLTSYSEALDACDEGLRVTPGRSTLMAYKGIVLNHLGEHDAARALTDPNQLVWTTRVAVPSGFKDLDDFNKSLTNHALAKGKMIVEVGGEYNRFQKATRDGGFVRDLQNEPKGPIAAFEQIIESATERYLDSLTIDRSHPFLASRPEQGRMDIWGNFLGPAGNLTSHHHPAGWLSGVYYAKIPGSINNSDPAHGGWIEFGRPHPTIPQPETQQIRLIQPEEGVLILFPSFVFHRTLPNPTADERISFSFDLCPV